MSQFIIQNRDAAVRLAHDQLTIWLEDIESRMPEQIEKMLIVDPRYREDDRSFTC